MKTTAFFLIGLCMVLCTKAQNTDLPSPDPNLQTVPAGSYVIAMDNALQVNSSGNFNLKAYGLLVYLLNNDVRLRWCIKAGKAKDGIDFIAPADQIKPTLTTGGVTRNFKAGPFVIFAADTTGVAALIDAFYSANALTGTNRPQVYRLTADALNVDIRYDLWGFRPKAAVLTDGGNQNLHIAYMTACSIPAQSYATSQGTDLISNCFTFASEPHNTNTGTGVNNAISAIKDFVTKGGNFLAQCEAVNNYENNTLGRFQTTDGITISNTNIGTTLTYANPDISFSQFEGDYNASSGGSLKNWKIVGSAANSEHDHAIGTGVNSTVIGASVSKHFYGKGGLVFYVGNHSFANNTVVGINGIRMYMNAFLTPSNTNCPSLVFYPLAVRLLHFTLNNTSNRPALNWTISGNEEVKRFIIERSENGINFTATASLTPTMGDGDKSYQYLNLPFIQGDFYRIKIEDQQGRITISPVVQYKPGKIQDQLKVLSNPVRNELFISYHAQKNTTLTLHLFNSSGALLVKQVNTCLAGENIIALPSYCVQQTGVYVLQAEDSEGKVLTVKATRL
jgi:hypothetical protein